MQMKQFQAIPFLSYQQKMSPNRKGSLSIKPLYRSHGIVVEKEGIIATESLSSKATNTTSTGSSGDNSNAQKDIRVIYSQSFNLYVWVFRAVYLLLIGAMYVYQDVINVQLSYYWENHIKTNYYFKHDSFEPVMASIFFAIYITGWMLVDFHIPVLRDYRIQQQFRDTNEAWKGRESALYQEAVWYLLPWLIIDFFVPRRTMPSMAPTLGLITKEVVLSLIGYDFVFFCGHKLMHKFQYLYRSLHSKHHISISVRAPDAIRHTFIDGTFDVFCSVITLNTLKAHVLSRSIFNIIAIYLIVEAHSGMNLPCMIHNVVPYQLVAGSVVHDLHHKKGNVNFQKFFTYLDYLFGSLEY